MAAKSQNEILVRWRDGIHITGTSIWCDSRRARDICVVSAADQMARAKHGQLVSTPETAALLDGGQELSGTTLALPYGRPFTLGTTRMELFRSGYGLGAASLRVDAGDKKVTYAGRVHLGGTVLGGKADIRQSDALIISARYCHLTLPKMDCVLESLVHHCREVNREGGVSALVVRSFLQALEVAQLLASADANFRFRGHFSVIDAVRRVDSYCQLPNIKAVTPGEEEPHILLWPMNRRDKLDSLRLPKHSKVALVSGMAREEGELRRVRADIGFPWADEADGPALREYIAATAANHVYWMDADDRVPEYLKGLPLASRVGPPIQMNLFTDIPARRITDRVL